MAQTDTINPRIPRSHSNKHNSNAAGACHKKRNNTVFNTDPGIPEDGKARAPESELKSRDVGCRKESQDPGI